MKITIQITTDTSYLQMRGTVRQFRQWVKKKKEKYEEKSFAEVLKAEEMRIQ